MPASFSRQPRKVDFVAIRLASLFLAGLVCLTCGKKPASCSRAALRRGRDGHPEGRARSRRSGSARSTGTSTPRSVRRSRDTSCARDYKEGSFVRKGRVLFEIDPRQFQASLDQAHGDPRPKRGGSRSSEARRVARFTPLVAEKAVSQQELDNALSAQRQAQANVDAARASVERAQLNRDWTKVVSPIDGIAGIAKAQVGNLVNPQTVMTTVSTGRSDQGLLQPERAGIHDLVPERAGCGRSAAGQGEAAADPLRRLRVPVPGETRSCQDRNVDRRTGTIQVAGVFPNPERLLRPGQYAKVRAVTDV